MSTPSLTVAYVVKGFLSRIDAKHPNWVEEASGDGEDTMFQHLCDFADIVEEAWSDDLSEKGWTGMWDYEVSEPLGEWVGEWLRDHGELPTHNAVRTHVANTVKSELAKHNTQKGLS